ncbi:MAG: DinB family protein [Candidatus Hodarchaeota archaeon]
MNKQQSIQFFNDNHKRLFEVLSRLNNSQMVEEIILGKWTVKDILAHISAWNIEILKAINNILNDEKPWFVNEEELNEAEFNKRETQKRKSWSLEEIVEEWQDSFEKLIKRIENLSNSEWEHQVDFVWKNTTIPVSIESLLGYTYKGEGHEGGHAKQIEEYFKSKI